MVMAIPLVLGVRHPGTKPESHFSFLSGLGFRVSVVCFVMAKPPVMDIWHALQRMSLLGADTSQDPILVVKVPT